MYSVRISVLTRYKYSWKYNFVLLPPLIEVFSIPYIMDFNTTVFVLVQHLYRVKFLSWRLPPSRRELRIGEVSVVLSLFLASRICHLSSWLRGEGLARKGMV